MDPLWYTLGPWWTDLHQEAVKSRDALYSAWRKDISFIQGKLESSCKLLRGKIEKYTQSSKGPAALLSIAERCTEAASSFLEAGGPWQKQHTGSKLVSPPYARPLRNVPSSPSPQLTSTSQTSECCTGETPICIATFGWWERQVVSESALKAVAATVARKRIHVCVVTGLPLQQALPFLNVATLGYAWIGPEECSGMYGSAGFLVAEPWTQHCRPFDLVHPDSPRRYGLCIGEKYAMLAEYTPWVGSLHEDDHKSFLLDSAACFMDLLFAFGPQNVWWLGDRNLRGIAQGAGARPSRGSLHSKLSSFFAAMLEDEGLQALPSPPTHMPSGGTAGGAIDFHVVSNSLASTVFASHASIQTSQVNPPCYSDHLLSFITSPWCWPLSPETTILSSPVDDTKIVVINWKRVMEEWLLAVAPYRPFFKSLSVVVADIRTLMNNGNHQQAPKQLLVACAQTCAWIPELFLVMSGHAAQLVTCRAPMCRGMKRKLETVGRPSKENKLLRRQQDHLGQGVELFNKDKWDLVLSTALSQPRPNVLLLSWTSACEKGKSHVQKWLSSKTRRPQPRLVIKADSDAAALLQHRQSVSRLDSRCSQNAEKDAVRAATCLLEMAYRVARLPDTDTAAPAAEPHLVQAWLAKRASSKAAAWLPVAAFKAMGKHDDTCSS
jgi:hypothetical protein